jgi:hypothetical protein
VENTPRRKKDPESLSGQINHVFRSVLPLATAKSGIYQRSARDAEAVISTSLLDWHRQSNSAWRDLLFFRTTVTLL